MPVLCSARNKESGALLWRKRLWCWSLLISKISLLLSVDITAGAAAVDSKIPLALNVVLVLPVGGDFVLLLLYRR